jgi:ATP-binding protein involved in chromosome partitioning
MSWFTPANHLDEKYYIFGQGGGQKIADEFETNLLGQIPLVAEVGVAADKGKSVFNISDKKVMEVFEKIVNNILS